MTKFYLNLHSQSNGDHEVHKEPCDYYKNFKSGSNFEFLGTFSNEIDAVKYAKQKYSTFKIDGCAYCCPKAHRS